MSNLELMSSLLKFWEEDKTFQKSIAQRSPDMVYNFYDGPPFASGSPHYGHLLAGSIKDIIPRYMTMRGYQVKRKRGWDCHGLPVEKAVEKNLGIDGKKDIEEKIGIESFVEQCRAYVNKTNNDWKWFVDHTGRWADIENPYFTMDLDFMESVIWCFSSIYNQNKVYRGFKVQGYCPSCATPLANNEISDGYQDKQDSAITVKFAHALPKSEKYTSSDDGFIDVVAGVLKNKEGKYFMIHQAKENLWFFPGGKVDAGESREDALKREIKEEIGINCTSHAYLWGIKIIHLGKPYRVHWFEIESQESPALQEPDKHGAMKWIAEEEAENNLGFAINIEGNIIDDEREIIHDFIDFYLFKKVLNPEEKGLLEGKFNFLAWTTTPWTLPSNMFLAVGKDIDYVTVYDYESKEYYVLAENLLKKYYKNPSDYALIYKQKGSELAGLSYQPLFNYIDASAIEQQYKDQFFSLMVGDFVSTEDGTGIVHIAPGFWEIDFMAVAEKLGEQYALDWLFVPVDEYGCFDQQVKEFEGKSVLESNKEIIELLKGKQQVVKTESITHSYPHCRRCNSPLIYKAMSSWFIKEKEMNAQTYKKAEKINFVPDTVKNRFVNGLQSAPDWNIARNRYWGSPLPIWENIENDEDHFSLGTLEELYQYSKTGSKNLTKNIFIRHGRTDFNEIKHYDGLGVSQLTDLGKTQAKELKDKLQPLKKDLAEHIFILSPLQRTWQTMEPTLLEWFWEESVAVTKTAYETAGEKYRELFHSGELLSHMQSEDEKNIYQIHPQIFVDFRLTDHYTPWEQGLNVPCDMLNWRDDGKPIGVDGESLADNFLRVKNSVVYWNSRFATKTLIYTSHNDTIALGRKVFRDFDYAKYRKNFLTKNAEFHIHYRDNGRNKEVDLHKPYVDAYRFVIDGKTYKRIPQVMDCWFESGSMPFGQDHYLGEENKELIYPADFIAEGLDQTRGRFRSLHVVGHAIKGENAFKNVVVNGLILAEDGKKMSKSLQNYPDPRGLLEKRGGDAFRLYTLGSPVVKAEPMKFIEKGVEQAFKDFSLPLENVFKFFETYAKIDQRKHPGTEVNFLPSSFQLDQENKISQETIIRINPDLILSTEDLPLSKAIARLSQKIHGKKVEEKTSEGLGTEAYLSLLQEYAGKKILIIGEEKCFKALWKELYWADAQHPFEADKVIPLPIYKISSELDKWILAELHQMMTQLNHHLERYEIDEVIKTATDFIEKLTNWYLRRSRRRFWGNEMTPDKSSAYFTLFEVMKDYLKIMAPFTPFITESLWKKLHQFQTSSQPLNSLHLEFWPFASKQYLDEALIQEIRLVRKAIKLALFIRSKNKIAVKQPLTSLQLKIE